jgi:hypothetical protein
MHELPGADAQWQGHEEEVLWRLGVRRTFGLTCTTFVGVPTPSRESAEQYVRSFAITVS